MTKEKAIAILIEQFVSSLEYEFYQDEQLAQTAAEALSVLDCRTWTVREETPALPEGVVLFEGTFDTASIFWVVPV